MANGREEKHSHYATGSFDSLLFLWVRAYSLFHQHFCSVVELISIASVKVEGIYNIIPDLGNGYHLSYNDAKRGHDSTV